MKILVLTEDSNNNPPIEDKPGILAKSAKLITKGTLASIGLKDVDKNLGISDKASKLATTAGRLEVAGNVKTKYNTLINQFKELNKKLPKKYFVTAKIKKNANQLNQSSIDDVVIFTSKIAVEAKTPQEAAQKMRNKIENEFKLDPENLKDKNSTDRSTSNMKYPNAKWQTWVFDKFKRFNTGMWEVSYLDANGNPHKLKLKVDKNKLTFMTGEEEYYEQAYYVKKYFENKYGNKGYVPIKDSIKMVEEYEMNKLDNLNNVINENQFMTLTDEEKIAIKLFSSVKEVKRLAISGSVIKIIGINDRNVLVTRAFSISDPALVKNIYKHLIKLKNKLAEIDPTVLNKISLQESLYTEIPTVDKYPTQFDINNDEYLYTDEQFDTEDKFEFSLELTIQLFESIMLFLKLIKKGLGSIPANEIIVDREVFEEFKELFDNVIAEPIEEYTNIEEVHQILENEYYFKFDELIAKMNEIERIEDSLSFGSKISLVWDYLITIYELMLPLIERISTNSDIDFSDVCLNLNDYLNSTLDYNDVEVEYLYNLSDYTNYGDT